MRWVRERGSSKVQTGLFIIYHVNETNKQIVIRGGFAVAIVSGSIALASIPSTVVLFTCYSGCNPASFVRRKCHAKSLTFSDPLYTSNSTFYSQMRVDSLLPYLRTASGVGVRNWSMELIGSPVLLRLPSRSALMPPKGGC